MSVTNLNEQRLPMIEPGFGETIQFAKYTAFGNTFIIIDETADQLDDDRHRAAFARWLLNKDFGIGGTDNVLYLRAVEGSEGASREGTLSSDFIFRIFEHDGSETLSCGNGLLSTAAFLHRATGGSKWRVLTELPTGSPRLVEVGLGSAPGRTWVNVGWPRPVTADLYLRVEPAPPSGIDAVPPLTVLFPPQEPWAAGLPEAVNLSGSLVFTGEPHLVLMEGHGLPTELAERIWVDIGKQSGSRRVGLPATPEMVASNHLIHHIGMYVNKTYRNLFPQGVHLNFARIRGKEGLIEYRTWERALDCETLACGSGAVAMAYIAQKQGLLDGTETTLWPHRCRWYQPDASLQVMVTERGFLLSGRPQLVCYGTVPKFPPTADQSQRRRFVVDIKQSSAVPDIEGSLKRLGLDIRPIPVADHATPEALQAAVAKHRSPLLFRGLADRWPARKHWSPSELARCHGHKLVTALMALPCTGVLFPKDQKEYEQTLTFAEFIDAMLSAPAEAPCYLAYQRAHAVVPAKDYDFASLLGSLDTESDTRVWIGSAGTRSMLHSDLKDNLFCQIWGEKHFVLLPWADSSAAYPFPDNIVNSQLDLANLDLKRYPRLKDTFLYTGSVGPGDVLFMPRGWWHDIRSKTASVSVNHWFGPPLKLRNYVPLLIKLGPRGWWVTARDFIRSGVLRKQEAVNFFFSPSSTGKRLFDALRSGDFSRDNDPLK